MNKLKNLHVCHLKAPKKCRGPQKMLDHIFETTDPKESVVRCATRLEGARSKKQVSRFHFRSWDLMVANLLYWRKYLWHSWNFWAPQQSMGDRGIVSPCAPLYASECGTVEKQFDCISAEKCQTMPSMGIQLRPITRNERFLPV